jgi:hypothetical protein
MIDRVVHNAEAVEKRDEIGGRGGHWGLSGKGLD